MHTHDEYTPISDSRIDTNDDSRADTNDDSPRDTNDDMGWLRSVGSLKLMVSFAEYRLLYRALLQERDIILRSLPIVATP